MLFPQEDETSVLGGRSTKLHFGFKYRGLEGKEDFHNSWQDTAKKNE